jgi:type I restriction enzyme S subunit
VSKTVAAPARSRSAWKWVTLADVGKVITGNTPPTADAENYGDAIPFVKPTELVDRGIRSAPSGLAPQAMGKARVVPAGAVLVSCIGNLGKTGIAKVPVVFNENVVPEFGFYYAQTLKPWLYGESSATTIPIVNKGKFQQARFPLAPIDEQREIVAELEKQFSRLDEAVANLQRVKANLKRYKASVLKAAVEGRLVETEATLARREGRTYETGEQLLQRILEGRRAKWVGRGKYKLPASPSVDELQPLPDGWTWVTADQLAYLITSGSRGWGDFYSDTGVLFIRAQDIKTDALNLPDAARVDVPVDAEGTRSSVSEGDILVTITGANVTKSALVPALGELAFVSQHVALMKLSVSETAPFVFSWIVSPANGRKTLESLAYGAGKPGLSLEQVRSLPIALPPIAEQSRIVAEVDRHLSIIREVEAEIDANLQRALALRQSCLAAAFAPNKTKGITP